MCLECSLSSSRIFLNRILLGQIQNSCFSLYYWVSLLIKCHSINAPLLCAMRWEKIGENALCSVGNCAGIFFMTIYFSQPLPVVHYNKNHYHHHYVVIMRCKNLPIWLQVESECDQARYSILKGWQMSGKAGWFNDTLSRIMVVHSWL